MPRTADALNQAMFVNRNQNNGKMFSCWTNMQWAHLIHWSSQKISVRSVKLIRSTQWINKKIKRHSSLRRVEKSTVGLKNPGSKIVNNACTIYMYMVYFHGVQRLNKNISHIWRQTCSWVNWRKPTRAWGKPARARGKAARAWGKPARAWGKTARAWRGRPPHLVSYPRCFYNCTHFDWCFVVSNFKLSKNPLCSTYTWQHWLTRSKSDTQALIPNTPHMIVLHETATHIFTHTVNAWKNIRQTSTHKLCKIYKMASQVWTVCNLWLDFILTSTCHLKRKVKQKYASEFPIIPGIYCYTILYNY